jgi:ABC-type uncharacterized transport system involved in gliding motility auxiliary subunit
MEKNNAKIKTESIIFIFVILGFVIVINYLASKKFLRMDFTENKIYSISDASKNILRTLDDIVNIKVYFSKNLPPHLKKLESDVKDLLSEYKAFAGRNLDIEWIDPAENEEEKQKARSYGVPEIQMQTFEKDKAQVMRGYLGIAVLYEDKKEVLPVVQELSNFEYDLTQAIMKVGRESVPKVGVLKTDTLPELPPQMQAKMPPQTESTKEKYKPIFENLEENYDVELVNIFDGEKIDSEIKTLIIPDGSKYTDRMLFEVDQYFMNGGNLIVLADAVKVSFSYGVSGSVQNTKMLNLLEHYGARVEKNMVLDVSCGQVTIPQKFGQFQMNVAVDYPYFVRVGNEGLNSDNPAVSTLGEVILPWVSSISLLVDTDGESGEESAESDTDTTGENDEKNETEQSDNISATVLVSSSERSWEASGHFNLNPQQEWKPKEEQFKQRNLAIYLNGDFTSYFAGKSVPPVKEVDESDTSALSQIQLTEDDQNRDIIPSNKGRHLVVVGDSDFLTQQNAAPGNIAFILNVVDWLTLDENLISVRTRTQADRTIMKDRLSEESSLPNVIRWVNILTMPVILLIIGLVLFMRRRETTGASAPAGKKSVAEDVQTGEDNK